MLIGYARTSNSAPAAELAEQERKLKSFGVERVFTEQVASARASRTVLAACLGFQQDRDDLVVTTPGRLARSATDLLAIIADLEKRNIGLVILSMGAMSLDARHPDSKPTERVNDFETADVLI